MRRYRLSIVITGFFIVFSGAGALGATVSPGSVQEGFPAYETTTQDGPGKTLKDLGVGSASNEEAVEKYLGATLVDIGIPPEGDMPQAIVVTPDHATVLTCYSYSDTVTFLDVGTGQMTGAVYTGDYPVDLAVTSDGMYAVTTNVFSHDLTVIDIASQAVTDTISLNNFADVCEQPAVIEALPGTHRLVVGCDISDTLHVVDLDAGIEASALSGVPIWIRSFSAMSDTGKLYIRWNPMKALPDASRVLIAEWDAEELLFFDPMTASIADALPVDPQPHGIDVSPDGTMAVLKHGTGNRFTIVDPQTPSITDTYVAGFDVFGDDVLLTGDKQYIFSGGPINYSSVMNVSDGSTAGTIYSGSVGGFACTPGIDYGFIGNYYSRIFDLATFNVVNTITAGSVTATHYLRDYPIAASINSNFSEEIYVYDINGASGSLLASVWGGIAPDGDGPRGIAVTPDDTKAVTANILSDNVSIVDVASNAILDIAETGMRPGFVTITNDGNYILAANYDENFISVIDLNSMTNIGSVTVKTRPTRIVLTSDGERALVASINNGSYDYVSVVHLDGASSYNEADIPVGNLGTVQVSYYTTSGLDIDINDTFAAVCNTHSSVPNINIIDLNSLTVVDSVAVGAKPAEVAFSPTQVSRALVSNFDSDTVSVVAVASGLSYVEATIPVGDSPYVIEFTPDGNYAFVANYNGASVSLLRMSDLTHVKQIAVTGSPRAMKMDDAGEWLFVATTEGYFYRIEVDAEDSVVTEFIEILTPVCDLAIAENLDKAIVSHVTSDKISMIDLVEPPPTPTPTPAQIPAAGASGIILLVLIVGCFMAGSIRKLR